MELETPEYTAQTGRIIKAAQSGRLRFSGSGGWNSDMKQPDFFDVEDRAWQDKPAKLSHKGGHGLSLKSQ